jgi:hypothetical protein
MLLRGFAWTRFAFERLGFEAGAGVAFRSFFVFVILVRIRDENLCFIAGPRTENRRLFISSVCSLPVQSVDIPRICLGT